MNKNYLKNRIMHRIYLEYAKNFAWQRKEALLAFTFVCLSFIFVSIPNVLHNLPTDNPVHMYTFLSVAVEKTEWFIQIIISAFFIASFLTLFRFLRNRGLNFQQFFFKRNV